MLFVREDVCSNLFEVETKPVEGFYIELNLRNDKWLLSCFYSYHKNNIGNHLKTLSDFLDSHSSKYEKYWSLTSLIKHLTCYQKPFHPKCFDLILSNVSQIFQITWVIESELSGFYLMTLTVRRKSFKKLKPRVRNYRFKYYTFHFSNEFFKESLLEKIISTDVCQ